MIAQVITPWTGTGIDTDPYITTLSSAHPGVEIRDVTAQPNSLLIPDPNSVVVQVEGSQADIQAIDDDNDFYVLWDT